MSAKARMVSLSGFSINRRERAIVEGVGSHLATVKRTVEDFGGLIDSVSSGDAASARRFFDAVMGDETKADTIHRDLSLRVANGAFFGGVREDIIELLRSDEMRLFIADLKGSVSALENLIAAFTISKKEVLARVHSVEEFEESADSRKDVLLRELFRGASKLNPVTVIQLRDFIFVADDIADNAEDASDVVLVLIAKGYG
ncbi:MAG: DUF47 family protein [Thaumarchaeota archaeon]|nr:MAG: DUF47 family protein [Nitrososphaerota archaeon]